VRVDARTNRAALISAARRLIAAGGAKVSVNLIAEEAGVGIATMYRHFPTRDDLLLGVAADFRDSIVAVAERAATEMAADAGTGWAAFVRDMAALRPGALMPELAAHAVDGPNSSDFAAFRAEVVAAVERVLDTARRAGLVRADVSATRFQLGLATITRPLPAARIPELDDHEQWLVEVYLRGMRP